MLMKLPCARARGGVTRTTTLGQYASCEHLEQIPTGTVTFVQATMSWQRLSISGISRFRHPFLGYKFFDNNFVRPQFFGSKMLWTPSFSDQKFCLDTKLLEQIFLDPKFVGQKHFLEANCLDLKNFLTQNVFDTKSF